MSNPGELPDTPAPRRPRYKRIRQKDSWLRDRHDPTKEEKIEWEEAGMPRHVDIIGGFLAANNFVYGVPSKSEIFRHHMNAEAVRRSWHDPDDWTREALSLHYVQPSPIPVV